MLSSETATNRSSGHSDGDRSRISRLIRSLSPDIAFFVILVIVALPILSRGFPLSPIDEHTHLDYVLKAGQLQMPSDDELLSQDTLKIMACTTVDSPVYVSPCELEVFLPEVFPDYGFNTASEAQPTFYLATGLLARTIRVFTPIDDLLFSARLANWSWVAGAGALAFAVMRRRSTPIMVAGALAALLVINPVVVAAGTHVSPDSLLPLAGLLLFLQARRSAARPLDIAALTLVTGVLVSIDGAMGLALILAGAVVGSQWVSGVFAYRHRGASGRPTEVISPTLRLGALAVGGTVGPASIAMLRRWYSGSVGARYTPLPRDEWFPRPPFSLEMVLGGFWNSFPPVGGGYLVPPLRGLEYAALTELLGVLLVGGVVAFLVTRTSTAAQGEALVITAVGVFAFPILTMLLWSREASFWTLSPRFGIATLPVYFVVTGLAARNRVGQIVTVILATVMLSLFLFETGAFPETW